jgi:farnesyl-diphosphate farnesyltransferase
VTHNTLEDDLAWCYEVVDGVSRTFAITIAELNDPLSREICVSYLLCRVADTVEDSPDIPPGEQARLLARYRDALDPAASADVQQFREAVDPYVPTDPNPDWQVVAHAPRVVRTFDTLDAQARESIRPQVLELVDGMETFVERYADEGGLRIQTIDELEEYCWYAAGTVGVLVTALVSRDAPPAVVAELDRNNRSFALLLQLVNVAKDVGTDYETEDNVYLPEAWLSEADVTTDGLTDPDNATAVASVVQRLTDHAATYLDGAQAWLEAVPESRGNTLAAWLIPFLLAAGTIRELRDRAADPVAEGDVKVSREEVAAVIAAADRDSPDVGRLRKRILARPLHEY